MELVSYLVLFGDFKAFSNDLPELYYEFGIVSCCMYRWLALLLRIRGFPDSNIGLEIGCSEGYSGLTQENAATVPQI
jgi:hypothetical protein